MSNGNTYQKSNNKSCKRKRKYTEQEALDAIKKRKGEIQLYKYKCLKCKHWHLTHITLMEFRLKNNSQFRNEQRILNDLDDLFNNYK